MVRASAKASYMVRILCVLALLFLGLAHRPAVEVAVADPLSLAYQLPDGSSPDLCIPQAPETHKISYPACDACRLAASVILPPVPAEIAYVASGERPVYVAVTPAEPRRLQTHVNAARGPPSFLDA